MVSLALLPLLLASPQRDANLYQFSGFEALRVGHYDGTYRVGDLPKHGDFGLGTFNALDGEMVVLDGKVYRINGFGDASQSPNDTKTPFAFVTQFHGTDLRFPRKNEPMTRYDLEALVDKATGDSNAIVAIRIDGTLRIDARSFPPQQKPYLPFGQIGDRQSLFHYEMVTGTMVGFRMPKSVGTLNVPGYHFHFLTQDRKHGGHVLSYTFLPTRIQIEKVKQIMPIG